MRYVFLMLMCVAIGGCSRYAKPSTPQEMEDEEQMMRQVLNDSSPRNMNDHPKVTDEIKRNFSTGWGTGYSNEGQNSEEDVPLTKQSQDDVESWW